MGQATDVVSVRSIPMLVSYVLRVNTDRIERDEFAGEIEAVASGRKGGVNSLDELMTFVQKTIDSETSAIRAARVERDEAG
jgi:hypothetical protein